MLPLLDTEHSAYVSASEEQKFAQLLLFIHFRDYSPHTIFLFKPISMVDDINLQVSQSCSHLWVSFPSSGFFFKIERKHMDPSF